LPCLAILDPLPALLGPVPLLLAGGLLTRLRNWRGASAPSAAHAPYEVTCACGQVARGARLPVHQVIRCAHCGDELFVLPLSRLPRVDASPGRRRLPAAAGRALARWRLWALPALAAVLTILALVAAYHFLVAPHVAPRTPAADVAQRGVKAAGDAVAAFDRLVAAHTQMGRGNFRLALEDLKAARALRELPAWPRALRLELTQLQRQAELLADLMVESLSEVVAHAAAAQEKEWQADFRHRYRGKAVVLDLVVHAGPDGRYEHGWLLDARDEPARLELSDLELLRRLPLDRPQRLLFGARLAAVRREPGRGWVVCLEPDSAVLITDASAAVACLLSPEEPEVRDLLERQAEWAARERAGREP
jgi:hypothetical protein